MNMHFETVCPNKKVPGKYTLKAIEDWTKLKASKSTSGYNETDFKIARPIEYIVQQCFKNDGYTITLPPKGVLTYDFIATLKGRSFEIEVKTSQSEEFKLSKFDLDNLVVDRVYVFCEKISDKIDKIVFFMGIQVQKFNHYNDSYGNWYVHSDDLV